MYVIVHKDLSAKNDYSDDVSCLQKTLSPLEQQHYERMDAIARIGAYFPFKSITVYFILSNVIINNVGDCATQQRQLMIALLFIFCVLNILSCFTDTYTASNQNKYWVFIIPGYGPLCFSLPSDPDKDLVYDNYYLRYRDYAHAFCSVTTFLLIIIFSNPISMCLCPSGNSDGTSRFDPAIIRTVPILIAIIMSMAMVCLGPPRQLLGMQNVQETCQPPERSMGDNPIYGSKYPGEV